MTEAKSAQPQLPPLDEEYISAIFPYPKAPPVFILKEACNCRERQLLSALAENESLKAAKPLRMFVWDGRGAYKISVCAPSVAEARTLALDEIAVHGMSEIEGSPMFRAKAQVKQEQPHIYLRPNAELVLSENGETEELNICLESESAKRQSTESQLAAMKAERDKALEVISGLYQRTGIIDNGKCAVCRHGYRSWKLPGCRVPSGPCTNEDCLSRKADALLELKDEIIHGSEFAATPVEEATPPTLKDWRPKRIQI